MSMKELRKALKKNKNKDTFAEGDVIRWKSSGRYNYAAIKTPVGWFTTAQYMNRFVPQVVSFEELVDVLKEPGVTNIQKSATWVAVLPEEDEKQGNGWVQGRDGDGLPY